MSPTLARSFRKLTAIDIFLLGYALVLAEYALGTFGSVALGLLVLGRGHSLGQFTLGMYLICLGINYAPMLVYAVAIRNKQNAHSELGEELADKQAAMATYRRLSLLLLVPLLVPVLALSRGRFWSHRSR